MQGKFCVLGMVVIAVCCSERVVTHHDTLQEIKQMNVSRVKRQLRSILSDLVALSSPIGSRDTRYLGKPRGGCSYFDLYLEIQSFEGISERRRRQAELR